VCGRSASACPEDDGEWLSVSHVVESTLLRVKTIGAGADVMQRVMLSAQWISPDVSRRHCNRP
jgi:hypothetical protein